MPRSAARTLARLALLLLVGAVPLFGQTAQQFPNCVQVSASTLATVGGRVCSGTGSPESAVVGWIGDLFLRRDGSSGTTVYVKESGAGTNTGWVAYAPLPQVLSTAGTPQFTRLGVGAAADAAAAAKFTGQYYSPLVSKGNCGASLTLNWNDGNEQSTTLNDAGACTLTFTNPVVGGRYVVLLIQDGDGNGTVTWPGTVKWPSGSPPTLTTTGAKIDLCTFMWDGSSYLGACSQNY